MRLTDKISVWIKVQVLRWNRRRNRFKPLVTSDKHEVLNQLADYVRYKWPKVHRATQGKTSESLSREEQIEIIRLKIRVFSMLLAKAHFEIYGFHPTPENPFPFEEVWIDEDK